MFQGKECPPLQNHYAIMTRERAAGSPRRNPTLEQVLSVRRALVYVSQGFITGDSLVKKVSEDGSNMLGLDFLLCSAPPTAGYTCVSTDQDWFCQRNSRPYSATHSKPVARARYSSNPAGHAG